MITLESYIKGIYFKVMNILQINNISKYTALVLLIVFGLAFAHSELDQYNYNDSSHLDHDYCKLVDDTTIQVVKYPKVNLNKLNVIKDLQCSLIPSNVFDNQAQLSINKKNQERIIIWDRNIYIQVSSFII